MVKRNRSRRSAESSHPSLLGDAVSATVHALWTAAEKADAAERADLTQDIIETVNHLKGRIENRLGKPVAVSEQHQLPLRALQEQPGSAESTASSVPRFPEPALRVFAKDFADHALQHLPQAAKYHSIDEFRSYLTDRLRFNSQATRVRFAEYIVSRFFPGKVFNDDLPLFAAATAGTASARRRPLLPDMQNREASCSLVAEEVVFPSLAQGGVSRARLAGVHPARSSLDSKSADEMVGAIVRTYQLYGIGTANRTRLECIGTRR